VIVHARDTVRGRLANISTGGMRLQLSDGEPPCVCGEAVEIELHLDRAGATWLRFQGQVQRCDDREVAIGFTAVPLEFAIVVEDALLSVREGAAMSHVLLVDANADRRVPFAALLRKTGCRVAEAATPLEAISHLGGSAIHSWVVAITDSTPASIADELRRFLTDTDAPPVDVVALGRDSPSSSLTWFTATERAQR
jgi:CheY-like chemotaxis protein